MSETDCIERRLWHDRPHGDPKQWSISRLAYVGDAVFEMYVRMAMVTASEAPSGALHGQSIKIVSATAQVAALDKLQAVLTVDEANLVRRGRNAKISSMPKHADKATYRLATGFEALLGYLYLDGQDERIAELCRLVLEDVHAGTTYQSVTQRTKPDTN